MATPYLGEIRMFAGNFAPAGWAMCDGGLLSISEYDALFALIGTTYGGDGEQTFRLPDLRGRIPIHQGVGAGRSRRGLGESAGATAITLMVDHLPAHSHTLFASTAAASASDPTGRLTATATDGNLYGAGTAGCGVAPPQRGRSAAQAGRPSGCRRGCGGGCARPTAADGAPA